jgi:hypothetical protein
LCLLIKINDCKEMAYVKILQKKLRPATAAYTEKIATCNISMSKNYSDRKMSEGRLRIEEATDSRAVRLSVASSILKRPSDFCPPLAPDNSQSPDFAPHAPITKMPLVCPY